jgi:hypothetical protein
MKTKVNSLEGKARKERVKPSAVVAPVGVENDNPRHLAPVVLWISNLALKRDRIEVLDALVTIEVGCFDQKENTCVRKG